MSATARCSKSSKTGITREYLGICVRKGNAALKNAIEAAQTALTKNGTIRALIAQWLGTGAAAVSG